MSGIWRVFQSVYEMDVVRGVRCEGGVMREARGVGRVRFRLEFEEFLEIEGVLYVPGLDHNLLSVPSLEDAGYVTMFKRGRVHI